MADLVRLSTPGLLHPAPAASFERALFHLAWAGIDSGTTVPGHAMRTFGDQEQVFFENYTSNYAASAKIDKRWYRGVAYWRRVGKPAAAIPGTSNHGNGNTVDWQNLGAYGTPRFMRAATILTAHGWDNTEGASIREPWHWTYVAANDKQGGREMADIRAQINEIHARVMGGLPGQPSRADARVLDDRDGGYIVAKIAGLEAAVRALATSTGAIDPAVIEAAIDKSVQAALGDLRIVKG